ncbi:MAG: hypothetical protein IAE78_16185 [Myxococcus sp.]|nr:hypothetical protein [Myxococcus sp.]
MRVVIFKEIVGGDLRKLRAESNDADSGGGARDFRFPHREFGGAFSRIFSGTERQKRGRGSKKRDVSIPVGRFYWERDGKVEWKEARYEPPTDSRPTEGRIPVVHTYPPLRTPPPSKEGRLLVLIIQREDGTVWPAFATEDSLRRESKADEDQWADAVRRPILKALADTAESGAVARGVIDLGGEVDE